MTSDSGSNQNERPANAAAWKEIVAPYEQSALRRSLWQVINSLVPYAGLWYLMYLSLGVSGWLTAALMVLAGGFLMRVFIIFHDCGHGSFFKSRKANDILGCATGLLCFTPYYHWRWEHALHHATAGDLDRRGAGDMWTLTVKEYLEASRWERCLYPLARNPIILFGLAPAFLFVIKQRFHSAKAFGRDRNSVYWTNLAVLAMVTGLSCLFGFKTYLLLQLGVLSIAGSAGVWLFYVQHQFEGIYWERREHWDYWTAALQGSSFYKLPKILQWFSGSIGFHHVHHLSSRIPNYNLERCHRAHPLFQSVKPITVVSSLKSLTFRLWDEQHRKLVGFRPCREAGREHVRAARN